MGTERFFSIKSQYVHKNSKLLTPVVSLAELSPFYLPCKKLFFDQAANISSCWQYFFCLLKSYHPMQKMMIVVIDVFKFGQEICTMGIFCKFLYKYRKTIPVKAAFLQYEKNICSLHK